MKPKAPKWLRLSFRDGVDERFWAEYPHALPQPPYRGASPYCWLARFDRERRPCAGKIERCHFISRQRTEASVWEMLRDIMPCEDRDDLILNAAWNPKNAVLGCGDHHARFDHHATPAFPIPPESVPGQVRDFASEWGLEAELEARIG